MNVPSLYPMEWLHLTTRLGDRIEDPTEAQMWEALRELDDAVEDAGSLPLCEQETAPAWHVEGQETSLGWRDGTHIWFVAAFVDGRVVFGEAESGDEYVLPSPIPRARVMQLWRLLREHRLDELRREDWQPRTYGSP